MKYLNKYKMEKVIYFHFIHFYWIMKRGCPEIGAQETKNPAR